MSPNPVAYSIGTVLGGFLFVVPGYLLARGWNFLKPDRRGNPWTLPLAIGVLLVVIALTGPYTGEIEPSKQGYNPVFSLGVLPAFLVSLYRWHVHRKLKPDERNSF